jgi:hypothetical protein
MVLEKIRKGGMEEEVLFKLCLLIHALGFVLSLSAPGLSR